MMNQNVTKTIFITITRGTLARNILRSGVLTKLLEEESLQIVIIIPRKIHKYFFEEFNHPRIKLESVPDKTYSKIWKFFSILFNGLVYTETEHRMLKFGGGNKLPPKKSVYWIKHVFFSVISKIKSFKFIARWIEQNIFIEKDYDYLFETYHPNLVFCSSIYSKLDIIIIKSAKRFKIPSLSMPKSWDTVGRLFFRVPSDVIILNNEFMKDWVVKEQLFPEDKIEVSGFPQFDIYKNKERYLSREDFFSKTQLDPSKPVILYASEGLWTHWDEIYIDDLIKNQNILDKYNLILRPHFSNLDHCLYDRFRVYKNIFVDSEHIRITHMFGDDWDPTEENMDWTAEIIYHSDVVITFMSTFVLDAQCYDKPIINIYYDLPTEKKVIPMKELYNCVHYNAVLNQKSVVLAESGEDVMFWIKKYLEDKSYLHKERMKTIETLCYKFDGKSSERVAQIILSYLK